MKEILKRSSVLLFGTLIGMFFLLISNKLLTKFLTVDDFGQLSYVFNLFTFIQTICSLGIFYVIGNKIAKSEDKIEERKIIGLALILSSIVYLIFILIYVVLYLFYLRMDKPVFSDFFLISIPLVVIYSFNSLSEAVYHCFKNNSYVVMYRALPRCLFFFALIALSYLNIEFLVGNVLALFLVSYFIIHFIILFKIKPIFGFKVNDIRSFFKLEFGFGFNVYLGSIISLGAVSFTGILLGFFETSSSAEIGFYNLAIQLSAPLTLVPSIIVASSYSSFVNLSRLSKNYLFLVFSTCFLLVIVLFFLSNSIVDIIYGSNYKFVSLINKILLIGYLFYGLADCFNKFILAKGKGVVIRNTSIIVGFVLLISNFSLIPFFGAIGAAVSVIIAGVFFLFISIYNYFKIVV